MSSMSNLVRWSIWPAAALGVAAAVATGAGVVESVAVAAIVVAVWNAGWKYVRR